ncbi:hypothetical protein [Ruficoccus sp. ZRK36]|uniref:hypothetical protein n=1 Tax=Ruficoccus sp. ZRK36 TaxID=2866311 RepID=UPI001C72FFF8|nr:hypothetical protein [Ruficoccus sp. ZRK36]QYY34789.1 hypothetical protein K0V07_10795 [Ruficoccus sp. ZRK36]
MRSTPMQVGPVLDVSKAREKASPEGDSADGMVMPQVQVRLTQNNYFQVAGEDYVSVQFVTHMAEQAGELGYSLVPLSNALPLPILVELVPPDKAGFEADFMIRPQPNGDVHVSIRWDEDTRFSQVCQALMSAYLVRCAVWRFGLDAAAEVPDWLELGAGLSLEVQLRPALIDDIVLLSREDEPWPLEQIFALQGIEAMNSPEAQRQCLWLIRFLQNQSPDSEHFNRLMAGFLKNLPPFHLLVSAFPEQLTDEQKTALWWAVGYEMAVRARQTPFYSLNDSLRLLRESASITAEIDGGDVRVRADNLYPYRGNTLMAKAALQRVREIKLQLQKVNPVYYNSLLTLGMVYSSWIELPAPGDGDPIGMPEDPTEKEQAFFDALDAFVGDVQAAQVLDADIQQLLNW